MILLFFTKKMNKKLKKEKEEPNGKETEKRKNCWKGYKN